MTINYFAVHTGKTVEQIASDMERDLYMSAEDAVAYGVADSILKKGKNGETS
jgi:ATP-dependent Clp protease protease subunit